MPAVSYQVWNRRQRKRGGRLNPPEKWVWSDAPAHESLVSREMFDRANVTAIKRDNVTKAAEGHDEYPKHNYVLRSFLHCGICGLRMHGNVRRGRDGAYYKCELNRRQASLVPEDHPRTVYLREDGAGEKVVEFLSTHAFGPERVDALRDALATTAPGPTRLKRGRASARRDSELADEDQAAGHEPGGRGAGQRDRGRYPGAHG